MAADAEVLDMLESKINALEQKVYGDTLNLNENPNGLIDSLLQANTLMTTAISGREKFALVFKRLYELNSYLDMNPLSEDPTGLSTKLNVILSMKDELEGNVKKMEEINKLKNVIDSDKLKNTQLLSDDFNALLAEYLIQKEKLSKITNEMNYTLVKFNDICLEISKSFFVLNEALTKLESR